MNGARGGNIVLVGIRISFSDLQVPTCHINGQVKGVGPMLPVIIAQQSLANCLTVLLIIRPLGGLFVRQAFLPVRRAAYPMEEPLSKFSVGIHFITTKSRVRGIFSLLITAAYWNMQLFYCSVPPRFDKARSQR